MLNSILKQENLISASEAAEGLEINMDFKHVPVLYEECMAESQDNP